MWPSSSQLPSSRCTAQDIEGSRGWFTNDGLDQILQRDDALQQVSDRDALAGPVCGDPGEYLGQAGPAVGRLESWPGSPRFIDATGAAGSGVSRRANL
jgi:hypothetical protein